MVAVLVGIYLLLWRNLRVQDAAADWSRYAWASLMFAAVLFNAHSALHREQSARQEFAYRVPLETQFLLNGDPVATGSATSYIAGSEKGYRLATAGTTTWVDPSPDDDLSFSAGPRQVTGQILVEKAGPRVSRITDTFDREKAIVENGRNPMRSPDRTSRLYAPITDEGD